MRFALGGRTFVFITICPVKTQGLFPEQLGLCVCVCVCLSVFLKLFSYSIQVSSTVSLKVEGSKLTWEWLPCEFSFVSFYSRV